jgi:hypothetical protein
MRVTNEQAKADTICELYCPDCELANKMPENWQCTHGDIPTCRYAKDLLEARELIKEMREILNQCDSDITDGTCNKAVAILAKSKDYV